MMRNIFSRSMQLNYFIALINQIDPKFVITTIDNSITFSKLTKYFEIKLTFAMRYKEEILQKSKGS